MRKIKNRWKPKEKAAQDGYRTQMEMHRDRNHLHCNSSLLVSRLGLPGQKTEEKHTVIIYRLNIQVKYNIIYRLNACNKWLPRLACLENFLITALTRIFSLYSTNKCYACHSIPHVLFYIVDQFKRSLQSWWYRAFKKPT